MRRLVAAICQAAYANPGGDFAAKGTVFSHAGNNRINS
jgi:hypothetical protein